ncbi:MAG: C4-dicarboxylate ABC transporter substrate-binding protein, partial [Candidatus Competibacteraceae bacterium]|nr:C4-dicarboxylate ABC transporter substrate-binding protein [Candidatus Competibacteraceae bacterium]
MKYRSWLCSLALGLGVLTMPVSHADELPGQLSWTAYGTGSAGYNQAVAIGSALKNQRGIDLRVLPGKNDVSRQVPLRAGKVQFSATGV